MPPRPRPKPKLRLGSNSQPFKEILPSQDEEDSIFIKSGNLTTATWKQMNQMPSHDSYEDYDSGNNEDRHKTAKKPGGKHSIHGRGKSRFDSGEGHVLCIEDTDDEPVSSMPINPKAPHSRSRSITPPPELAPEQKMKARNLVRQALGVSNRRSVSPQSTWFNRHGADDTEAFDPELVSIALRSTKTTGSLSSQMGEDDHPQEIIINVQWRHHPSEGGQKSPRWTFHVNRSEKLRQVFKEVADTMRVPTEDVVLTLKGHRIYSSVSPAALGIWSDEEFGILPPTIPTILNNMLVDACLGETYELLKDDHLRTPSGSRAKTAEDDESGDGSSDGGGIEDVAEDTFKLTLRSLKTPKGVVLIVRPQTKCGAIVKAYLRKTGLANDYLEYDTSTNRKRGRRSIIIASGPRLVVDGDKLDNEIEIREADVEDGDIVEVAGL